MEVSEPTIWRNFRFVRFFTSFTIGNIGDWFDIFALQIIFVHEWHASPMLMGVLILFYFLPAILLGPIAGVWADRVSQRNLMLITDGLAAVLTLGLYFSPNVLSALILLIIRSSVVSFNVPAQQAYIKQVVSDNQLLKASSYTSIVFQMCKVMGPILGAAVLLYTSARACLLINVFSFLLSTIILFTLPKDRIEKHSTQDEAPKRWTKDLTEGAKYVWSVRLMRITLTIVMLWFFCSMLRQAQLAIFLKYLLPQKQNALGLFMGLDGLGAVTSSIFISRKKYIANHHRYFFLGFLLLASGILGVAIYQASWPHYILYLFAIVIGLGTGVQLVNYSYILKKETPKKQIGRVSGIATALQSCALTLGTLSSGFFVLWFGIREVYLGLAAIMLILAIASLIFIHK